jgi:medium-chain acyl-[acyl-carrier-protein] hydrolase
MTVIGDAATAAAAGDAAARWFPLARTDGPVRLYCLPHAGGSASTFGSWDRALPEIAVRPVQPPGRESRRDQTPYTDIGALVGDLAPAIHALERDAPDRSFAVYGHSLGALVGFELLRELRRLGTPAPAHFFVSGAAPPDHPAQDCDPRIGRMSDAEIADLLRGIGGTPEWLLRDPAALRLILPILRADFAVRLSYSFRAQEPLDVPLTAIAATRDPRAATAHMSAWERHTSGRFVPHTLEGGHFAVFERPEATHAIIRRALAAASGR